MATHAVNIENLRTATLGEQVRGSMIELFEEDYNLVKDGISVGTVISSASDPITGFSDGAVYINSSSWKLFKLEGTAWALKGTIRGAQGESVESVVDNEDGTFYFVLSDGTITDSVTTIPGAQGPQGPQGPQGLKGDDGDPGRGVTTITMSGTGKEHPITATYSDGTSQVVGIVKDGNDGSGIGDMLKATYDVNNHGYVDAAAALTDGEHTMPYSAVAAKADKSTTLAGYGITNAYTKTEVDNALTGKISKPGDSVTQGKVATSNGAGDITWEDSTGLITSVDTSQFTVPTSGTNKGKLSLATGITTKLEYVDVSGSISDALDGKVDEPLTEGTNGQVLTTDGNGGRSWTTVQSGSDATWGSITGTLSAQTDLQNALNGKANTSQLDGWTNAAYVNTNMKVTFSSLNDAYAYDIYASIPNVSVVNVEKSGSGTSMSLIYTLSGATAGTTTCKLRIIK